MSVLISALATLQGLVRTRAALHLEVLALRHQLQVVQRSRPRRLRLAKADRCLWAWLARAWGDWRTAVVIVKPEAVIAWHCQSFRVFWIWKSRRHHRRPPVAADTRALIRTMSAQNPVWGTDSRRALETRDRDQSGDRGQIHGKATTSAIADLAHLSGQSRAPDRGCRFLRGADGAGPALVRVGHSRP